MCHIFSEIIIALLMGIVLLSNEIIGRQINFEHIHNKLQ